MNSFEFFYKIEKILQEIEKLLKKHKWQLIKITAAILLVFIFVRSCNSCKSEYNQPYQRIDDTKITAYTMAQVFVKEVLKAPSTAQFETYRNNLVQDLGNNRYQINSYVDSQNSFGAMLRAKYSIIIVRQFSHNWVVESLVFDGKVIK